MKQRKNMFALMRINQTLPYLCEKLADRISNRTNIVKHHGVLLTLRCFSRNQRTCTKENQNYQINV